MFLGVGALVLGVQAAWYVCISLILSCQVMDMKMFVLFVVRG